MFLTAAMMGQSPARSAEGEFGQTPAPAAGPAATAPADPLESAISRARSRGKLPRTSADRKAALRRQVAAHEREDAIAQRQAAIAAQQQYERMLPYMLENQRQQLNRMSAMERNATLQRMADAAEKEAQAFQWYLMQRR
jgi:hypothetical protein